MLEVERSVLVRFAEWIVEVDKVLDFNDDKEVWVDCVDEISGAEVAYIDEDGDLVISDDIKNSEGADYIFTF